MNRNGEPEGSTGWVSRRTTVAALVGGASVGVQVLVPLVWPKLDRAVGLTLLLLCLAGLVVAGILLVNRPKHAFEPARRWSVIGIGQGWVEARVRNNAGDQVVIACNPGADANQITILTSFRSRTKPRQSDAVELLFDVDGEPFEWDVADAGGSEFALNGSLWREVQTMKLMVAAMRQGAVLNVSVPTLDLRARFTLVGAFDTLVDAATLGDQQEEG